jgi:hypothetical protein
VLTISGIIGAVSTGLRQGLDFYLSAYFWELTPLNGWRRPYRERA